MRRRIFRFLAWLATRHAWAVLLVTAFVTVGALHEARTLTLKTGEMDLTPPDNPVRAKFKDFLTDFDVLDDVFLLVAYQDETTAKAFARAVKEGLRAEPQVKEVFARLDLDALTKRFLYLIDRDKLDKLLGSLRDNAPLVTEVSGSQDLESLFTLIEAKASDRSGGPPDLDQLTEELRLVLDLLAAMTGHFARPQESGKSLWRSIFMPAEDEAQIYDEEGFIISTSAKKLLMIVKSSTFTADQAGTIQYFGAVRAAVERIRERFPGISVGYAGAPAVTYDESNAVVRDMYLSTILALTGITLLFVLSLQSIVHPMAGVAALVVSLIWTFGLTRLCVGHLTLVSSTFTANLIGNGIGFGIHVVSCYEEERAHGAEHDAALENTLVEVGPGVVTGASTSTAAFFTMLLTEFTAFKELGFIAGTGLLITMLNMLLVLPALLTVKTKLMPGHRGSSSFLLSDAVPTEESRPILAGIGNLVQRHALIVVALFTLAAMAAVPMALNTRFDYNLLNLQASGSAAVLNEQELVRDFNISPEFNAVIVPDLATAHRVVPELQKLQSVARVESITDLIPGDLAERLRAVAPLRPLVEAFVTTRRVAPVPDPERLAGTLGRLRESIRLLRIYAFMRGHHELVRMSSDLDRHISNYRLAFDSLPYEVAVDRLNKFQKRLFDDLITDLAQVKEAFATEPYSLATVPPELLARFQGRSGKFVIYLFPRIDVREEVYAKRFIRDTASVGCDFTGLPVIKDEMIGLIRTGFKAASLYSVIALTLMVLIDFRRVGHSLMVMASLVCGTAFTLGGMFLFDVKFNPANFISVPIILGMGVDNGVHIMQRYLGGAPLKVTLLRTGRAITLNSMTTALGFGSLALSSYQGFASLGLIMVAGTFSCLLTAVVLQPALMTMVLVHPRSVLRQVREVFDEMLAFRRG